MEFQRIYEEANITDDITADSMDLVEDTGTKTRMSRSRNSKPGVQHLGHDSAGKRLYRLAAVCLGLLCVLLLTVMIVLSVKHTAERNQLLIRYINTTKERNQFQTSNINLTKERDEIQKRLSDYEIPCREGWWRLGYSCYYISTEKKTWNESRQDCREREADLFVINSREEQVFVSKLKRTLWIGLTDSGTEGTWKWVDGTPLTSTYWKSGQPNSAGRGPDCVEITEQNDSLHNWNDEGCSVEQNWICEK